MAETKIRGVRIDDDLWEAAQAVARQRRESVADAVRRGLLAYVKAAGRDV
jgi:antitoxin component of RelBE/YafQ-DinJ toxin-antitoxin module